MSGLSIVLVIALLLVSLALGLALRVRRARRRRRAFDFAEAASNMIDREALLAEITSGQHSPEDRDKTSQAGL